MVRPRVAEFKFQIRLRIGCALNPASWRRAGRSSGIFFTLKIKIDRFFYQADKFVRFVVGLILYRKRFRNCFNISYQAEGSLLFLSFLFFVRSLTIYFLLPFIF